MRPAARAQLYAVPVLGDLLAAVREPAVQGLVSNTAYGTGGETVTQAFIRILTAQSGDWPIMFAPTAFDIGHVRIAAIDLADVAPQGSPEAARQTAAFYLLARHALTRHWWIGDDSFRDIPEPYRPWHATPPARYSRGAQAASRSTSSIEPPARLRCAPRSSVTCARPASSGCVCPWPRSGWRISAAR